ncbi:aminotransferase [bacterium]|nr:aminotransferase [bacterium]|tara:strand:- start:4765 stop:5937 length:1173 start_codon:yes stop_codon:yes gene_type:complete
MSFPSWPNFDEESINSTVSILKSGKVNYWTGIEGKKFEREFANWCGTDFAIALSNGSVALTAAYMALGIKEGDEIITTPRTFIATASTAMLLGARILFADVDTNSGCINVDSIKPLINKKTKAIVVVHLAGWPADMHSICALGKKYNISIIEDCSQAHGAKINGKNVGSFGDIATWSFCQDKIVSTAGEGGMITTSNENLWRHVWSLKDHGKDIDSVNKNDHSLGYRWLHETIGTNFRLTEIQSSIGRYQLKKLTEWNRIRTENALILIEKLRNFNLIRIPLPEKNLCHAWYKFYCYLIPSCLKKGWDRDRIISEIISEGYPAYHGSCSELYLEKCFENSIPNYAQIKSLPNAKLLGETSLMFLVHPTISRKQMKLYADVIANIIKRATS